MSSPTGQYRHAAIDTVLGPDKLLLKSFSGREELGRLFDYHLTLVDPHSDIDPDDLVGTNATVRLELEDLGTRYFNGYISSMVFLGYEEGGGIYHASFVPWLWMLSRTSDCRSYQNKTVKEIIEDVFNRFGFTAFQFKLTGNYKPKPFCVQYNETALNFVSRLLEHEGIYYWWEHNNGVHKMVITDAMSTHTSHPHLSKLEWRQRAGVLKEGYLYDFRLQKTVAPGAFAVNDYNFQKPKQALKSDKKTPKRHAASQFEHFEYPGMFREDGDGTTIAQIRLEEAQAAHETVDAMVTARAISTGYKFQLQRAERKDQNRSYLVVSTVISISVGGYTSGGGGDGPDKFDCHITAVPDSTVFRPARLAPKPVVFGPQPGMVVGRPGREIDADKHGRVKVHFYWDRYSAANFESSKWVRVSQPSAGGGYGFSSHPRVGQEVLVEFMNGDPDQPIITGRVYNGDNEHAYNPETHPTRSAWKTNSSPGGGGYNELRFEDKKGNEQIFVHGEKDMDVKIKKTRKEYVGGDQHTIVGGEKREKVGKDLHQDIAKEHRESVGKNHFSSVGGDELIDVAKAYQLTAGDTLRIEASKDLTIQAGMGMGLQASTNLVLKAMSITLVGAGGFVQIDPGGVTIQGVMVKINSGGSANSAPTITKKNLEKPKPAAMAEDSKAGKVEKAKGGKHASKPQTWKKTTVRDIAAQDAAAFYGKGKA